MRNGIVGEKKLLIKCANVDFGQIAVALFFIISGAALMYSYEQNFNIKNYYKKRWLSIYPMFYIAYIGTFLFLFFVNKSINHSVPKWTFVFTILGMDGYMYKTIANYNLVGEWFLGCIVLIYIFFPVLRKLLIERPKTLAIVSIVYYIICVELYPFDMKIDWNFIIRITDFLIGMYFIKYIKNIRLYQFIISVIITMLMLFIPIEINSMYKVTITGISSFFVLVYITKFISNVHIRKVFETISKYSFAIFLVHNTILKRVILNFRGKILTSSELFCALIITFIIIVIVSRVLFKSSKNVSKYFSDLVLDKI